MEKKLSVLKVKDYVNLLKFIEYIRVVELAALRTNAVFQTLKCFLRRPGKKKKTKKTKTIIIAYFHFKTRYNQTRAKKIKPIITTSKLPHRINLI